MVFQRIVNETGRVSGLNLGGRLVLDNSQQLKSEFVDLLGSLDDSLHITVSDLEEIDVSCIQLLVAFFYKLDEMKVKYKLEWKIDDDQMQLLENVGLNNDFF